ncbi:MAG: GDSL-type esterase/lipase family protein [Bacteroides sp.]|nr:GDSL-type esterase/lipase family protein [Bacteroides sp.]
MKKLLALILASSLLLASGCSDGGSGDNDTSPAGTETAAGAEGTEAGADSEETVKENTEAPAEETASTVPPVTSEEYTTVQPPSEGLSEEEQREYMINNSLMTLGDTSRMINVMKKAEAGEEITVGFIGGSITEGISAGDSLCYAKLTHNALSEMFPDTTVNYINAGLSGTPSVLGVVRAERDLFADKQPDIIFIEFAVNDGGDQQYKDCYESLVKKCLDKENQPAVVLLFTVLKNRYSCQPQMAVVGEHYGLPMISVGNAINPMFDAGLMTWESYSDDESHPNIWGHELVKDFNMNYFNKVKAEADAMDAAPEITPLPDTAVYTAEYSNLELLERSQLNVTDCSGFTEADKVIATFNDGWMYRSKTGASVTFTAEFKTLFLVFNCNNTDSYADAEVYIDGELVNTMPSCKSGGWGNPEADHVWTGSECKEHTVEVRVAPTDNGMYYGLIGVGVGK